MREILFRGKHLDNGEWVVGFHFCMLHDDNRHVHQFIIPLGTDLSPGTPIERIQVEVDPETVCQYTGLKDEYGREIYEEDVIRYTNEITGLEEVVEIKYNEFFAGFCRILKSEMGLQYLSIGKEIASSCEVIGNIFDNPELVRGTIY